jgi:hypothetical protein
LKTATFGSQGQALWINRNSTSAASWCEQHPRPS